MTDTEFLDGLQRRAAKSAIVFVSKADMDRLCFIARHSLSLMSSSDDRWAISATNLYATVVKARKCMVAAVRERLKG